MGSTCHLVFVPFYCLSLKFVCNDVEVHFETNLLKTMETPRHAPYDTILYLRRRLSIAEIVFHLTPRFGWQTAKLLRERGEVTPR